MKSLPTLFYDKQELLLDIDIYGKIVSTPQTSREDLAELLFEEFKFTHPVPTMEDERYKLSDLVSTDYKIQYDNSLELQDNETLVDLQQEGSEQSTTDIFKIEVPKELQELFSYGKPVDEDYKMSLMEKFALLDDDENFGRGIATTEKLYGSVKENSSSVLSDEEIDNIGKEPEEDEEFDISFEDEEDDISDDEVSDDYLEDADETSEYSDDEDEEEYDLSSEDEDDLIDEEEDFSYSDDEFDSSESNIITNEDENEQTSEEVDEDSEYDDMESDDDLDDMSADYDEDDSDEDDEEDVDYSSDDDLDDEDDMSADYDEGDSDDDMSADYGEDDMSADYGEGDSDEDDDMSASYDDDLEGEDDFDMGFEPEPEPEPPKHVNIQEPVVQKESKPKPKPVPLTENRMFGTEDTTESNQPSGVQDKPRSSEFGDNEPKELRAFLKKHPRCEMSVVLKYFSKKEVETQIRLGKVIKRGNTLRI